MGKLVKNFFKKNEKGQGVVEYGLIIGLIAVIVVAIFIALGPQIKKLFERTTQSEQVEIKSEQAKQVEVESATEK